MEHATCRDRDRTASMASAVVACSRTIRSVGKEVAILVRWVRKCFSAFRIEMFYRSASSLCTTPLRH
jgi:hypothetical protein